MNRKAILIVGCLLLVILLVSLSSSVRSKADGERKADPWKETYTPATNPPSKAR